MGESMEESIMIVCYWYWKRAYYYDVFSVSGKEFEHYFVQCTECIWIVPGTYIE